MSFFFIKNKINKCDLGILQLITEKCYVSCLTFKNQIQTQPRIIQTKLKSDQRCKNMNKELTDSHPNIDKSNKSINLSPEKLMNPI